MNKVNKEEYIRVEVDSDVLKQAKKVCRNSGVTLSSVLSVFLRSLVKNEQIFIDFYTGKRDVKVIELLDPEFFYLLELVSN